MHPRDWAASLLLTSSKLTRTGTYPHQHMQAATIWCSNTTMSALQSCLEALLMRSQVHAVCFQRRSLLSFTPLISLSPVLKQQNGFINPQFCSSSQHAGVAGDSSADAAAPNDGTVITSSPASASPDNAEQQHPHTTASAGPYGCEPLQNNSSPDFRDTGFAVRQLGESNNKDQQQLIALEQINAKAAPERLRILYRAEEKHEQVQLQVDAYSLTRTLSGDRAAVGAADQLPQQQQLTAADKEALEKLVGILTKDGKKSRARRLLLNAMHIVKQQLSKGGA